MKLSALERRWARAIFEAMFPGGQGLPVAIADTDIEHFLDQLERAWPAVSFWTLRASLTAVAFAPALTVGALRTIDALDPATRVRVLDAIYESPIYFVRQLAIMLKTVAGMHYGAIPAVRDAVAPGFPVRANARESVSTHREASR